MKQVVYMAGKPIQYPGEIGRRLPIGIFDGFTELEAEHLFLSARRMETFFNHLQRKQSIHEAYAELMADLECRNHQKMEQRITSYILEVDIFLKHWEKYFGQKKMLHEYKKITSAAFDSSDAYALVCIFRNYLVHSSDIIHGQGIRFSGMKLWTERDVILSDFNWPAAKRDILKRQEKQIDLVKMAKESLPVVDQVYDQLMDLLIDDQVIEDIKYLTAKYSRVILINATSWAVFNGTGIEFVEGMPGIIGTVHGKGIDWVQLRWSAYEIMKKFIEGRNT